MSNATIKMSSSAMVHLQVLPMRDGRLTASNASCPPWKDQRPVAILDGAETDVNHSPRPPLGLIILAALTPPEYHVTLCDESADEPSKPSPSRTRAAPVSKMPCRFSSQSTAC